MARHPADASESTSQAGSAGGAVAKKGNERGNARGNAEKGKAGEDTVTAQQKADEKARKKAEKKANEVAAKKAGKADKRARKAAEKAQPKDAEAVVACHEAHEVSPQPGTPVSAVAEDRGVTGLVAQASACDGPAAGVEADVAVDLSADLDRLSFCELLKAGPGFLLSDLDPGSTPGFDGTKEEGTAALQAGVQEISDLQERLYAQARGGGRARLLLVVQGMDTSGKGGIMRHVVGLMDPQGVDITAFKAPSAQEKSHPFLWRIRRALPEPGQIGVFDRSHYEDVLVVRVHNLVPSSTWTRRYGQINTFEATQTKDGITMIKVMLHLSKQEQGTRLAERLERPDKHWKFNPDDIQERARWEDYQVVYQAMLDKTSTDVAPWYVVPADRKWYARLAVQRLVLEHLRAMNPQWPKATFDVEAQKQRLAKS